MWWFHDHCWKVNGVTHLQWRGSQCPCSEVLLVCMCGEVKTINLTGHWTLEQLQPQASKGEADTEFFRKLGVKL